MPSIDFVQMSDQELSDIVAFITTYPPVDTEVPPVRLGPLGVILAATGPMSFSADRIAHQTPHAAVPPRAEVSTEFGSHLAGVCVGCHRESLAGGPIVGGDPSWAPAGNLTPHADGLAGWTLTDFRRVLLQGTRPDGSPIRTPMDGMVPFAQNMTDVEIEALWAYLQSIPPAPTPQ
jgi:cytochrome c553